MCNDPRLFDYNPFEKNVFIKEVKNQPVEISIQPVVLYLVYFEKDLKKFDFV